MNDIPSDVIGHMSTFLKATECLELSTAAKLGFKKIRDRAITIELMSEEFTVPYNTRKRVPRFGDKEYSEKDEETYWGMINMFSLSLLVAKKCAYFSNWRPNCHVMYNERKFMNPKTIYPYEPDNHEFRDQDFCYYYNPAYDSTKNEEVPDEETLETICENDYPVKKIIYTNKVIIITYYYSRATQLRWLALGRNEDSDDELDMDASSTTIRINMSLTLRALVG